jgi:hypothetical protein
VAFSQLADIFPLVEWRFQAESGGISLKMRKLSIFSKYRELPGWLFVSFLTASEQEY